jgi:TetR/AcrR family transcriptional regulator, cholesterol catabolism regulator
VSAHTTPGAGPIADSRALSESRWPEIVDAAAEVFFEKGYQSATLQEIAARVGLLAGSLYYYIDTKEDLLFAFVKKQHERGLSTLVEDDVTAAADAPTRLSMFVQRWMRMAAEQPPKMGSGEGDIGFLRDDRRAVVLEQRRRLHNFVREIVEQGIEEGTFDRRTDAGVVSNALFGVMDTTSTWFRSSGRLSNEEVATTYANLFLRGIQAQV